MELTRRDLLRRVGNLAQVGDVELVRHQEGHARGVRSIVFVDDGAELLADIEEEPHSLGYSVGGDAGERGGWRTVTAPQPGFTFEGYVLSLKPGPDGKVGVALVNRRLRGGLGVYLRYDARLLPAYLAWRMMREGLYAIGLEPATNPFGNPRELIEQGFPIMLAPGETRTYELEFGVLAGLDEIEAFA